jgi:hypothetical protein
MMLINSQIWRQVVNAEWRELVGAENQARPSVGMFKLGEMMNLTQRNHVRAIRLFGGVSNSEQAVA